MTAATAHTLVRHREPMAVVRLDAGSPVPDWVASTTLQAVVATRAETSVVCAHAAVPRGPRKHGPLTAFAVAGPLDLALTGVLSGLLEPLAAEGVPVFTLATYDTDWVLVAEADADRAARAWERAGHTVRAAEEEP